MFNDFYMDCAEESMLNRVENKKEEKNAVVVHSSLDYHTIKVPPMVEYKSIDSYCERKGEQLLSVSDATVSSRVVFRTPQPPQPDTRLPSSDCKPFCFFSVEELSLVTVLTNWSNRKVCPVGTLDYVCGTNECYLNSVGENGSWKVLLDVSNLKVSPVSHKLLQVYGVLNLHNEKPKIDVCFVRNPGATDLPLLVESYKLIQKYIPRSINMSTSGKVGEE